MPVGIAYNALALHPGGTGVQTYIRELLAAMVARAPGQPVTFAATIQGDARDELPAGVDARTVGVAAGLRRALLGLRSLGPADLVHGLDVDIPLRSTAPMVTTVHDLTPFDVPWTMSKRKAIGERLVYRRAVRHADAVIAVSSFTAERLETVLGCTASVVLEGTPTDLEPATDDHVAAVVARHGLPPAFVLHVGTLEPRKDVPTVAAACRAAGVPLVLAGRLPTGESAPAGALTLGYVERRDLPALYAAATVTAVPSRYEGFGLPALEAMRCGSAVIGARAASLPEVLGDAAVLVAPGDVDAWTAAIKELAADDAQRGELEDAGRRRADALTWSAAADGTAAVYASLGVAI